MQLIELIGNLLADIELLRFWRFILSLAICGLIAYILFPYLPQPFATYLSITAALIGSSLGIYLEHRKP